jgi:hypothetical protein
LTVKRTVAVLAFAAIAAVAVRAEARWDILPTVTVAGPAGDPRIQLVFDAVEFWNRQSQQSGSPFRLGSVIHTSQEIPSEYLQRVSAALLGSTTQPDVPDVVSTMPGDIIVALSDGGFVSFSAPQSGGKVLIGIRSMRLSLALPNVARNVIAHELGHAIGLRHNSDPTTLMCGRPAPCRPDAFQSMDARFFPLTDEDRNVLLRLYPADWKRMR